VGKRPVFRFGGPGAPRGEKKAKKKYTRDSTGPAASPGARAQAPPPPPPSPPRARAPRAPPRVARARAACRWGSQLRRTSCQDPPVGWVISKLGGSAAKHGLCAVQYAPLIAGMSSSGGFRTPKSAVWNKGVAAQAPVSGDSCKKIHFPLDIDIFFASDFCRLL
jgi:hypothetical protein